MQKVVAMSRCMFKRNDSEEGHLTSPANGYDDIESRSEVRHDVIVNNLGDLIEAQTVLCLYLQLFLLINKHLVLVLPNIDYLKLNTYNIPGSEIRGKPIAPFDINVCVCVSWKFGCNGPSGYTKGVKLIIPIYPPPPYLVKGLSDRSVIKNS